MIKLFVTTLLIIGNLGFSQNSNLTINVTNLKNDTGVLTIELYNSKENFLKKTYRKSSSSIKSNSATVIFSGLPEGEYSFLAYHDKNNNGKLDKYLIGMPKEAVACSNNAKGFMGPPKYKDAKFTVTSIDSKINIKMSDAH